MITNIRRETKSHALPEKTDKERGAALVMALLIMGIIGILAMSVLSVVTTEANIASSDLQRTRAFYAASSSMEKMTSDFGALFGRTTRPTSDQLNEIAADYASELSDEGFIFEQTLVEDAETLAKMRATQGIADDEYPTVHVPSGPFNGLLASVVPYRMESTATLEGTDVEVGLERDINNYLIPLFQFGTFGAKDLEFWPEPPMTFNGRVHANGNIYFGGDITFEKKVSTANEAVRGILRNGGSLTYTNNPRFKLDDDTEVRLTIGSVNLGPNLTPQPRPDGRGKFTDSPDGTDNSETWDAVSVAGADGTDNQFGGLLQTKSTGALPLLLPLQLGGRDARELIKRQMPDDSETLSESRYHTKAHIRILIDDENVGAGGNVGGIPAGRGVNLGQFNPSELHGGNALRVINDSGAYLGTTQDWYQGDTTVLASQKKKALTVRGVRNDYAGFIQATQAHLTTGGTIAKITGTAPTEYTRNLNDTRIPKTSNGAIIPPGAGIRGRILIEVVNPDGEAFDVTREILSMGVTVGEPNAIIHLQRPLWAAFMQGSRDRTGGNTYLTYFYDNSVSNRRALADGEMNILTTALAMHSSGFIKSADNNFDDDPHTTSLTFLPTAATMNRDDKPTTTGLNQIVPINVYNVREGRINESTTATGVNSRGITSVVEINMRNLARWLDGVYDNNLLNGTEAVSTNFDDQDGFVVYVSDRRGDRVKSERNSTGATISTTNGMVDNEDIYSYPSTNWVPNPGEDVIDDGWDFLRNASKKGTLQRDILELPDPTAITFTNTPPPTGYTATGNDVRYGRALRASTWPSSSQTTAGTTNYYFRRAIRLFNGEDMQVTGADGKLCETKGLTVATENMVYIWGNYNTTGILAAPEEGSSTLNDGGYQGDQVPASIVADAFFPISKTWFDAVSSLYPEGANARIADASNSGSPLGSTGININAETSVRAGIIAGSTLSAKVGTTPSYFLQWLNGGVHNFPRFLETWGTSGTGWEKRWNYVGSFILLYNSTQAVGPWGVISSVNYYPPQRNWAFDITFTNPRKLPPGTPLFQHVEATGFRQNY